MFWKYTDDDIKTKLKLKLGLEQARVVSQYEAVSLVLNQAFGGSKEKENKTLQTFDQAMASFNAVIGKS